MAPRHLLVKRHGHVEEYDHKKVYASVYAAALSAHLPEEESERLAERVMWAVDREVRLREAVDSHDIQDLIVGALGGPEEDVAFLYLNHLDIN